MHKKNLNIKYCLMWSYKFLKIVPSILVAKKNLVIYYARIPTNILLKLNRVS